MQDRAYICYVEGVFEKEELFERMGRFIDGEIPLTCVILSNRKEFFMKWHKYLSAAVFLLLLLIPACVKNFSKTPTPMPLPDENFIKTSVAATLTALAPATLTFSPTPFFTDTLNPGAMTPHDFMYYYFDNINRREYSLTWSLLTDSFKARLNGPNQGGYEGYVAFWDSIKMATVLNAFYVCNGDLCAVSTTLQLDYANGAHDTSVYDYTVRFDHGLNTWQFDYIPAPTGTASRTHTTTRSGTSTYTFTRTATPTSTPTATFTSMATKTATTTATRTSTSTMTFTPSQTASMTATTTSTYAASETPTFTTTFTASESPTTSPTATETMTPTMTVTDTPSETPTETATSG